MTIVQHIKQLSQSEPEEQVLGYSPAELRLLFPHPTRVQQADLPNAYPQKSSLEPAKIHAVYTAILIVQSDFKNFMTLVERHFFPEAHRQFEGVAVVQNKSSVGDERLCFQVTEEFGGYAVRLVTDSTDILNDIDQSRFAPPPPWLAFHDYNPAWWGGSMQGAPEYYDDRYFSPFFRCLNTEQKNAYCIRFGASTEWVKALELFYEDDDDE